MVLKDRNIDFFMNPLIFRGAWGCTISRAYMVIYDWNSSVNCQLYIKKYVVQYIFYIIFQNLLWCTTTYLLKKTWFLVEYNIPLEKFLQVEYFNHLKKWGYSETEKELQMAVINQKVWWTCSDRDFKKGFYFHFEFKLLEHDNTNGQVFRYAGINFTGNSSMN